MPLSPKRATPIGSLLLPALLELLVELRRHNRVLRVRRGAPERHRQHILIDKLLHTFLVDKADLRRFSQ